MKASVTLFLTRWITNLCAPTFVFLAGLGCYLSFSSGKPKRDLSTFLIKRGVWMLFLELTILRLGWTFSVRYDITELAIIWAIGWSMIALAGLIHLPLKAIAVISLVMIAGHNALDGVHASSFGAAAPLWTILHERGVLFEYGSHRVNVLYPLIPWIGVMALGFSFGGLWRMAEGRRARLCTQLGLGGLALFAALRIFNLYGDPRPWATLPSAIATALAFIRVTKYPPSLDFLLIMLSFALLLLAAFERIREPRGLAKYLLTFGRVPMFYYLVHIYAIHGVALVIALFAYGLSIPTFDVMFNAWPGYGHSLAAAYAVWITTVAALYPACAWFAEIKRRHKHPLLSYL